MPGKQQTTPKTRLLQVAVDVIAGTAKSGYLGGIVLLPTFTVCKIDIFYFTIFV